MGYCKPIVGIILKLCRSFRWMVQVRTALPSSTVFATSTTSACYVALLVCNGMFGYPGILGFSCPVSNTRAIQCHLKCNVLPSTSNSTSTVTYIKLLPSFQQSLCQREPKSSPAGFSLLFGFSLLSSLFQVVVDGSHCETVPLLESTHTVCY